MKEDGRESEVYIRIDHPGQEGSDSKVNKLYICDSASGAPKPSATCSYARPESTLQDPQAAVERGFPHVHCSSSDSSLAFERETIPSHRSGLGQMSEQGRRSR